MGSCGSPAEKESGKGNASEKKERGEVERMGRIRGWCRDGQVERQRWSQRSD